MRTLGYIGAFISGAIAGATLGVLMAPEKGTETQKKLTDTVNEFCRKHNIRITKQDINDFVEKLHKSFQKGHCDFAENVQETIDEE